MRIITHVVVQACVQHVCDSLKFEGGAVGGGHSFVIAFPT